MADSALPVPKLDWESTDAPQAFKKFKDLCELMFEGPLKEKSEEEKCKYLLIWSGEEGRELRSTWNLSADDAKKLASYWTKFEEYLSPKSNFRLARFKLRSMRQSKTETVDAFVKRVRVIVSECKYADGTDHILDTLIFGTNSERVQGKLLQKDATLTLNTALDIARREEVTKQQLQDMAPEKSIDAISKYKPRPKQPQTSGKKCGNCGQAHFGSRSDCPAFGTKCASCGKRNHWASVCRSQQQPKQHASKSRVPRYHGNKLPQKKVHAITEQAEDDDIEYETLHFGSIQVDNVGTSTLTQALTTLQLESSETVKSVTCKLDTGAEGNVMPVAKYKDMFPNNRLDSSGKPTGLQASGTTITGYGGNVLKQYGLCNMKVKSNGKTADCTFYVVEADGHVILGLPTCLTLDLVSVNCNLINSCPIEEVKKTRTADTGNQAARARILEEYGDCFRGIGCFKGEYTITLDKSIPPVAHAPRKVPAALEDQLKSELNRLEQAGVLSKVTEDEPTDWVNSLVCATKPNGKLRLCLDPKDLNQAIKRPYHATRTLDNVLHKLNGMKYVTILDALSGYWNIKLSKESSYLTTFNTPQGRYRFNRLPFGLKCAQDVFQRKVDETFGDLPGVTGIADDILVIGYKEDGSDHDEHLHAVLERAKKSGLKFNPDKLKVKCKKLMFFGNIISSSGLEADPAKVEAIRCMGPPSDVNELQTFLGLATYLARFTPQLSALAAPLRDLCKKDAVFTWSANEQKIFDELKTVLTSHTVLQYFNKDKPVTIQVDASQRGLGAALLQDGRPIEYASKSLSSTEQNYSNIEREMLGVVFGLERFHYYAYGRKVIVETDHKPLESIFKKNINCAPPRIGRMVLRIQKYDVEIKYVPGRDIPLADALSRVNPCAGDEIKGLDITIHEIHAMTNVGPARRKQIQEETAKDSTLASLMQTILHGWPETRSSCPANLLDYWNYRDELAVEDGLILKGTRVVIPRSLVNDVLLQIHFAHQGIEKCKLRAKGSVFWHKMGKDIEDYVNKCPKCQANKPAQVKEPLLPHDVPPRAWHTIGSDLFHKDHKDFLIVVDYYSKFPIVKKLSNTSSKAIITHLKAIFSEYGVPEKLVSDNGLQSDSMDFLNFCEQYGITHSTSSPMYARSNGQAERTVQTV